jgi:hypothetical protein
MLIDSLDQLLLVGFFRGCSSPFLLLFPREWPSTDSASEQAFLFLELGFCFYSIMFWFWNRICRDFMWPGWNKLVNMSSLPGILDHDLRCQSGKRCTFGMGEYWFTCSGANTQAVLAHLSAAPERTWWRIDGMMGHQGHLWKLTPTTMRGMGLTETNDMTKILYE